MIAAPGGKRLDIILPSYNDERVLRAIDSVRAFDDANTVSIILIDGGSKPELVDRIADRLTADDVLISERDKGIFDALNKGLSASTHDYIGWLGSDDSFSGEVLASEVLEALDRADLFVAKTIHTQNGIMKRITPSWPARYRLARLVVNNPHFSTFGRSSLLKLERFSLELRGADIEYFLRVFGRDPVVRTTSKVATFMEVGGFSNAGIKTSLKMHLQLFEVQKKYMPAPAVPFALLAKLGLKFASSLYLKLKPGRVLLPF